MASLVKGLRSKWIEILRKCRFREKQEQSLLYVSHNLSLSIYFIVKLSSKIFMKSLLSNDGGRAYVERDYVFRSNLCISTPGKLSCSVLYTRINWWLLSWYGKRSTLYFARQQNVADL